MNLQKQSYKIHFPSLFGQQTITPLKNPDIILLPIPELRKHGMFEWTVVNNMVGDTEDRYNHHDRCLYIRAESILQ